jgi:hypothetical protein
MSERTASRPNEGFAASVDLDAPKAPKETMRRRDRDF